MGPRSQSPTAARDADSEATTDLLREAVGHARELVRLEIALVRQEFATKVGDAKTAAFAFGAATALALMALTMFLVAVALSTSTPWLGAILVGAAMLVIALALGVVGWRALPKKPLEKTKERIETDIDQVKERLT